MLGMDDARNLMRKGEEVYKLEQLADTKLTQAELISAMVNHPKLIERPIAIHQSQARIGRPPESVLEIL
jgi:arsenate reductase